MEELPSKNNYTNFKSITMFDEKKLDEKNIEQIVLLIQNNFLKNKENSYKPKKNNILPYFKSHNSKCFISIKEEEEKSYENNIRRKQTKKIVGVMTSRPLHIYIKKENKNFDVYYVDYLCVDKKYRKKGFAEEIIQTHEYCQRHDNKSINVSLFKREDELTGIIPLCVYKSFCFDIKKLSFSIIPQNQHIYKILLCDNQNIYYLNDFLKKNKENFGIFIMSEISNVLGLINSKNIYVYMVLDGYEIVSVYFFKKTCTYLEKNREFLSLYVSVKNKNIINELFIQWFKMSLEKLLNDTKNNNFSYLAIEDISNNNAIIQNIMINSRLLFTTPMAFFFYNFAYSLFKSNDVVAIY